MFICLGLFFLILSMFCYSNIRTRGVQKEVQKLQNFIADMRVENQSLKAAASAVPVLQKQIQDYEMTFERYPPTLTFDDTQSSFFSMFLSRVLSHI
jgi:hypothetical protein